MWNKCGNSACMYLFFSYREHSAECAQMLIRAQTKALHEICKKFPLAMMAFPAQIKPGPSEISDGITVFPLLCFNDVRLKAPLSLTRSSSGRVNKEFLVTSSAE